MLKLKKVAVTGGLSCGKSLVCRILQSLGAYVISADKVVHQLLSSDKNIAQEVVKLFGPEVLVNQKIDRSRVSHLVFNNESLLRSLEKLIHPVVYDAIDRQYREQSQILRPPPLFVAEIPLFFENSGQGDFDRVIVVAADMHMCQQRFLKSTGGNYIKFNKRVALQLPVDEKIMQADYVIMNTGSRLYLQCQTRDLYQKLIQS